MAIAGFAIRYLQVVLDELRRLQLARVARGDDARWLWQARTVARTAGALAVRCFERGERVHTAMLARGFDGRMPDAAARTACGAGAWLAASLVVVPALAALLLLGASRMSVEAGTSGPAAPVGVGAEPPCAARRRPRHPRRRRARGVPRRSPATSARPRRRAAASEFGFIELAEPLVDAGDRRARRAGRRRGRLRAARAARRGAP